MILMFFILTLITCRETTKKEQTRATDSVRVIAPNDSVNKLIARTTNCDCAAFFDLPKIVGKEPAEKTYYKKIAPYYNNEDLCNNFLIVADSLDYFKVIARKPSPDTTKLSYIYFRAMWLKKTGQFETAPRESSLTLYGTHDLKSKKILHIKSIRNLPYADKLFRIKLINCWQKWIKVELVFKNTQYIGWIAPYGHCPIFCTTCA